MDLVRGQVAVITGAAGGIGRAAGGRAVGVAVDAMEENSSSTAA